MLVRDDVRVLVGVARAGVDPTKDINAGQFNGLFATADGWMYLFGGGGHYHNFGSSKSETPWASGSKTPIKVGETVGLLLRKGSLSVYIKGACVGTLVTGLTGQLVWAADLHTGGSVRIAAKRPPK